MVTHLSYSQVETILLTGVNLLQGRLIEVINGSSKVSYRDGVLIGGLFYNSTTDAIRGDLIGLHGPSHINIAERKIEDTVTDTMKVPFRGTMILESFLLDYRARLQQGRKHPIYPIIIMVMDALTEQPLLTAYLPLNIKFQNNKVTSLEPQNHYLVEAQEDVVLF